MVPIKQMLVNANKYNIKCPYNMTPEGITVHNTANNASAENEIKYMINNNKETSYHYAIDDKEIIQGILENRNAWHAGDGNGKGNRKTIGIEICYSTGDKNKFEKAQENAAEFIAHKLKEYGWDVDRVYTHKHWSGKHCPHRTLDEYGWEYFINLVKKYMGKQTTPTVTSEMYRVRKSWNDASSQIGAYTILENAIRACKDGYYVFDSKGNVIYPKKELQVAPPAPVKKSNTEIAQEVIAGKWGNGATRKTKLQNAGYDYNAVQAEVERLMKKPEPPKPVLKSVDTLAAEVMAGKWGNGEARKQALIKAGYDYAAVQAAVNKLVKGDTKPKPAKKSNAEIAKEVMAGLWGNGNDRKKRLQAAGYDYSAIQAEVNKLAGGSSKGYKVQITASALNVRAGAGTNYKIVKVVRKGQIYTIVSEKSGWGKLSDGSGWISLSYTKKV